jgi:hypothetical protein
MSDATVYVIGGMALACSVAAIVLLLLLAL